MPVKKRRRNDPDPNPRRRRRRRKSTAIVRRKNPSRAAITRYAAGTIAGVNLGGALKSFLPLLVGALAAKFAAKKFTDDKATEGADWTWKNYGFALLGGFVAAVATAAIFRAKWSAAQKVMEGAFLLTGYKIFVNEIAAKSETLAVWFSGEEEPLMPVGQEEPPYGQEQDLPVQPGAIVQAEDGKDYVMGQDGMWRPVNEEHRLPVGYGDDVVPVRPDMGGFSDDVVPVRPDMGDDLAAKFRRAYSGM